MKLDKKLQLIWLKLIYQSMLQTTNSENSKEETTILLQSHSCNSFHFTKHF